MSLLSAPVVGKRCRRRVAGGTSSGLILGVGARVWPELTGSAGPLVSHMRFPGACRLWVTARPQHWPWGGGASLAGKRGREGARESMGLQSWGLPKGSAMPASRQAAPRLQKVGTPQQEPPCSSPSGAEAMGCWTAKRASSRGPGRMYEWVRIAGRVAVAAFGSENRPGCPLSKPPRCPRPGRSSPRC